MGEMAKEPATTGCRQEKINVYEVDGDTSLLQVGPEEAKLVHGR